MREPLPGTGVIRAWNIHELAREAVEELRAERPDLLIEIEHRGDGEGEWDAAAFSAAFGATLRAAASVAEDSLWIRTDAREDDPVIHVRWRGPLVAAGFGATVDARIEDGEARLAIRIPRR